MNDWNKADNVRIEHVSDGVSFEWDSWEEFKPDMEQIYRQFPDVEQRIKAVDWYGMNDRWWGHPQGYSGVMYAADHGWPELREKCLKRMAGIELDLPVFPTMTHTRKRKRQWGDHGDVLSMPRVWSGELDMAWSRPVRTERLAPNTKCVTLAFDVTANAVVSNDMAMWRSALCTLLVDSLARAGRTFEIWVIDSTSHPFTGGGYHSRPQRLWSGWCVKRPSDPLVLDRLCAMVSVGFMRSAGFAAMSAGQWAASPGFGGALGTGLTASLRRRQAEGEVVLRIGQCYSREAVIEEYRLAWEEVEKHTGKENAA